MTTINRESLRDFLYEHAPDEMERVDPHALNQFLESATQSLNLVGELRQKAPSR